MKMGPGAFIMGAWAWGSGQPAGGIEGEIEMESEIEGPWATVRPDERTHPRKVRWHRGLGLRGRLV